MWSAPIYLKKSLDHKVLHEFNALEDEKVQYFWIVVSIIFKNTMFYEKRSSRTFYSKAGILFTSLRKLTFCDRRYPTLARK